MMARVRGGVGSMAVVLLLVCWAGHVSMCMGRGLEDVTKGSGRSVLQYGFGDTECKLVGEAVANIAWAVACHQLKVLCHVGDGPSKKRSSEDSHYSKLQPHCLREAKSACRTTARKLVNEDVDTECSKLLLKGPDQPVKGCWNWQEAVDEFNWTIKGVCEQDPFMGSTENSGR